MRMLHCLPLEKTPKKKKDCNWLHVSSGLLYSDANHRATVMVMLVACYFYEAIYVMKQFM